MSTEFWRKPGRGLRHGRIVGGVISGVAEKLFYGPREVPYFAYLCENLCALCV
jgi:hypothetical protein